MSEKRFIVGETLRDYYQIKCEKKDYSRVLAQNTVARLLNEQQITIENLRKWLIAEQKQVEKRDAFIEQKGLMSEFVKELEA